MSDPFGGPVHGPPPAPPPPSSPPGSGKAIGPAVATFGVASAALAAAVIVANATTDDGDRTTAGDDPNRPRPTSGSGPLTGASTSGTGAPAVVTALAGDWVGEVSVGDKKNGVIVTIENDADPAAIAGLLQVADPLDGSYSHGGTLSGSLDGPTLTLTSNVDATFTLTIDGDALTGTGTFPGNGNPLQVQVRAQRS